MYLVRKFSSISSRKKWKVVVIIGVMLLFLGIVMFLGRGWVRGSGFEGFTNVHYQPQVEKQLSEQFSEVNMRLAELGIDTWGEVSGGCSQPQYKGFRISTGCYASQKSGQVINFEQLRINWEEQARAFENYMTSNGWGNDWGNTSSITTLFDEVPLLSTNDISYTKTIDKIDCFVRIGYNPHDTEGRKLFVDESCSRRVNTFGGY